jgi:hypothetical protein
VAGSRRRGMISRSSRPRCRSTIGGAMRVLSLSLLPASDPRCYRSARAVFARVILA